MSNKAPSAKVKFDGKISCWPGTNVVQTPTETPVAREVDVDVLVDNWRKISRFGAVYTDFKRFQNAKMLQRSQCFHSMEIAPGQWIFVTDAVPFSGSKFPGSKFLGSKFLGSKFPGSKLLGSK